MVNSSSDQTKLKVSVVCSGLGHVRRGYESFFLECFQSLRKSDRVMVELFSGAPVPGASSRVLPCLKRGSRTTFHLSKIMRRGSYNLEQLTFGFSLLRVLRKQTSGVIFFSDSGIGNLFFRAQKRSVQRQSLVFSNGGPVAPPFPRWDLTHQVTEVAAREAVMAGQDPSRQVVIPYGFNISRDFVRATKAEKESIRSRLGLPTNRKIVLSAGAINKHHKRHHHTVNEIAGMKDRPFLLMLGQLDEESQSIEQLAKDQLGPTGYLIKTVDAHQVSAHYQASDVLVHSALKEGFGRVLVEALASGLPVIAHSSEMNTEILQGFAATCDMASEGNLRTALEIVFATETEELAISRHLFAYQKYSWDQLTEKYVDMLVDAGNLSALNHGLQA